MPPELIDLLLDGPFELTPRPEPVPGDLRLAWGVALVVLLLGQSRNRKASLQKLHLLAHAVRTRETRYAAESVFNGRMKPAELIVRFEPWLNRALSFAKGADLVEMERGKGAKLTKRGIDALDNLNAATAVLTQEKAFLNNVGLRATEAAVEKIMRMELSL